MKVETFQYKSDSGWTLKTFPPIDSKNTILFLFGSADLITNSTPFETLREFYPQSTFIGCSSSGEIFGSQIFDNSLSVAVVTFSHSRISLASCPIENSAQSFETGQKIANSLNQEKLCALFVLSDGLRVNGSELVRGINSVLPADTIVTGGLAGDGSRFKETWVLHNNKPATGYITALGLYGDQLQISHGSQGGWDIFGPERIVTKSNNNILYELDGKPALQIYKEYLGEKAAGLPATGLLFPLQIRADSNDQKKIVRTILAVDEEKQSMIFAGDIPQGFMAQLMRANFDRLIEGAHNAANLTINQQKSKCALVLAVSCVGRRLVLGERAEEEVEATLENLPKNTKQIGFYSYGEISPYVRGQSCEFHNQTMTLTTISENETS